MKFFEREKHEDHIVPLQTTQEEGAFVQEMARTKGWKIIHNLLVEQVAIYQRDVLAGCKNWEEYLEKKARAKAVNLLLTDIEEFIQRGQEAKQELKDLPEL